MLPRLRRLVAGNAGATAGAAALAAAVALAPLARAWLAGLTVLHRDQTGQYAGLRPLIGEALRAGRLPLWNPYCATGMPLLAEPTHGALHPLSVAVAFLFPSDGLEPLVGAWVAWAALGAFTLARALGASRGAALVAGVAYGTAGWTLSMTSNLVGLAGAGSAPWVLAGLVVAARRGGAVGHAAAALGVGAGALAGDIQALAVTVAVGLVVAAAAGGRRGAMRALAGTLNGAVLAAIQLVPAWRFLELTDRMLPLLPYDKDQWDLAPWRLVELVTPGFFSWPSDGMGPAPVFVALGHPTFFTLPLAESIFVGVVVLLVAAAGLRASRTSAALAGSAAGVLWLALGRHAGGRAVQDLLPIASGWRYGEKYLTELTLLVVAVGALGVDRLIASPSRAARWARVAALASGTALLAWAGAAWRARGAPAATANAAVAQHLAVGLPHAAAGAAALAACLWLAARGRPRVAAAGVVAVVCASGWAASGYALRPGLREVRFARPPPLRAPAPGPRVALASNVSGRPRPPGWDAIDERNFEVSSTYSPNTNARWGVDAYGVDSGLTPLRWRLLQDGLGTDAARAARRYAVTHVVAPLAGADARLAGTLDGARLVVADERSGFGFWSVPHRAWASFPQEATAVPDLQSAVEEVAARERAGHRGAVVELTGSAGEALPTAPGRVLEVDRTAERVRVVAEADGAAVLVVNDAFWPGWRATLDGREVPIAAADALVRAVAWPAGRHVLEMTYAPPEVRVGAALSAVGAAALAALAAAAWFRRGEREGGRGVA